MEAESNGLPLASVPIPRSFVCPITQDVMREPVATVDGQVYDRGAIQEWFRRGNTTSPATNGPLPSLELTQERALKRAIEEYLSMRPELARPESERRSYQEAAEALQADMLEKQAATAGTLAGLKAKLMDSAKALLGLRGSSAEKVLEVSARVGMDLHALAASLEEGEPPAKRHCARADQRAGVAAAASSSSAPSSQARQASGQAELIPTRCEATLECGGALYSMVSLGAGRLAVGLAGRIEIWGIAAQRCEATLDSIGNGCVVALVHLAEDKLAGGYVDGLIRVWDLAARRCVATLDGHGSVVNGLAKLADGRLASGSFDNTIKIWGWAAGRCELTLHGHERVCAVADMAEGKLASGYIDGQIQVWECGAGRCEATLRGHSGTVMALALCIGGRLASASRDGTIRLWNWRAGRCEAVLDDGERGGIDALVHLGVGKLASGAEDGTVKVWDLGAQRCQATLRGHRFIVVSLASLGAGRIASGSMDGTVKIWSP